MTCPQCSREYEATFGTEATLRVCEHVRFPDVEVTPLTVPAERRFLSQDEIRDWAKG